MAGGPLFVGAPLERRWDTCAGDERSGPGGVTAMTDAAYDVIADWYESEFLAHQRSVGRDAAFRDAIGVDQAVVELLGSGAGMCLEVGCGTGVYGDRLRSLGWDPVGVDLSGGMLRHASGRLPVAQADATRLPFTAGSLPAVAAIMVHTDMPDYRAVLARSGVSSRRAASSSMYACTRASTARSRTAAPALT